MVIVIPFWSYTTLVFFRSMYVYKIMIGIINTKNNDAKSIKIEIRINTHSRMISIHNALIQISFLGRISLELAVIVFKRKPPRQILICHSVLSQVSPLYYKGTSGKAHTPKVARACPKAPSGRELPTKSGEGERVTIKLAQTKSYAGSFRHANACHLPPGGRLFY